MNKRQAKRVAYSLAASAVSMALDRGWAYDELSGNGLGVELKAGDLERVETALKEIRAALESKSLAQEQPA